MLRIKTLGGWGVTRGDGLPVAIPAQRVALLALLVAAGERGVSRDRAAALLWPERPDENARHSLGQSLYALRRDAESADVILGSTMLTLNPDVVTCDAWEVDAAVRCGDLEVAARLHEGPFLDGLHLRGGVELEQAIDAERARLAMLHADAVQSLARAATSRGAASEAAAWWRRLAAAEPFSSRIALELVRSLAVAGDRVAALQAARVHETLVREELDVGPDATFAAFVDTLRRNVAKPVPGARSTPAQDDRLVGPAERERADVVPQSVTPPVEHPQAPMLPATRSRRTMWATAATLASVALMAGATRYFLAADELDPKRVYIAWFENRTGDRALDQVGGMASDWISQGLERSGLVAVASDARAEGDGAARVPNASSPAPRDPSRQAADLGAGTVVSGAYYQVGEQLRFHVQISDVSRREVLDSFDAVGGTPADPTAAMEAVRQRAMGSLASMVDPRLSSWVRVASKPPTYQAYREFVTGQSLWGSDRRQALTHFLRAAALDSTFYAARVEAAILHRLLDECDRTEVIATELSADRDRLAPYDYHVLDAQVAQCHGDWERSYREAKAVADLRPGSAFLDYSVALQAMQLGRYEEARALLAHHALERGVAEVGPNYAIVSAQVLSASGDRSKAIDVSRWLRSRYRTYARAWASHALLLARDGRVQETERLIDTMTTLPLVPSVSVTLGMRRVAAAFMTRGDTLAARRTLTRALAIIESPPSGQRNPQREAERAQLLYELGHLDEARALLATLIAADTGNVDLRGYLGMVAARCGEDALAADVDTWLATARPRYTFTRPLYRARIAALVGQSEHALTLLRAGLDEGGRFMLPAIREYDEFASVRQDERFKRLVTLQ